MNDPTEAGLILASYDHLQYQFRNLIQQYGEAGANVIIAEAYQTAINWRAPEPEQPNQIKLF